MLFIFIDVRFFDRMFFGCVGINGCYRFGCVSVVYKNCDCC